MDVSEKRKIIAANVEDVRRRIAGACRRSGRGENDVQMVAVTKTVGPEEVRILAELGVTDLGENRVREAEPKIAASPGSFRWHMIGHLQRNKVKKALELFHRIDAVDSLKLAEEISRQSQQKGAVTPVLIEVNTGGEEAKFGVSPEGAPELAVRTAGLPNITVEGLMTIAPFTDDMDVCRACFRELRRTADSLRGEESATLRMRHLSMGMTQDFEVAVEEGATMVRIGTALFNGIQV